MNSMRCGLHLVPVLALAAAAAAETPRLATPLTVAGATVDAVTPLALDPAAYEQLRQVQRDVTLTGFFLDAETRVDLVLERFEILTPDARIVVGTPDGDVDVPRPDLVLLRGAIAGRPGSTVFLAASPHGTNGIIVTDGERFIIANGRSVPGRPTIIYNLEALPEGALAIEPFVCGTDHLRIPQADVPAALPGGEPGTCGVVAEIAVETDWELTEGFGGDTEASEAYALTLMAAVSEIFDRDAGAALAVSFLRVWADPDDLWTEPNIGDQLNQFREFYNANMQEVPRHTAHFLAGRQLEGAGGVAYLPGLCQGPWAYGLSAHLNGSFPYPLLDNDPGNWDVVVVAHELGHNFGAPHTHSMDPPVDTCAFGGCEMADQGTIMSYCHTCEGGIANIQLRFHERVIDEQIVPYLTSGLPCTLSAASPTISQHPSNQLVCAGEPATFSVTASGSGPLAYQWRRNTVEIPGANGSSHTVPFASIANAGVYDVLITNPCGGITSNSAILTIEDPASCDPGGGTGDPCPWDTDGDGAVGINDFLLVIGSWGVNPGSPADFDGDGQVGINDFLEVIGHWGPCP